MADHDTHDHTGIPGCAGSDDLDTIIAASAGQDIADALAGAAAPDAGNVFATMADIGGGGGALTLLSSDVLGSAAADITRTGLSSAYKDLIIAWTCRSASGGTKALNMRLGTGGTIDTGSNYNYTRNYAGSIGSGATGGTGQSVIEVGSVNGSGSTTGYFSSGWVELIDYATTRAKACVFHAYGLGDDGTLGSQGGGVWTNTSAALDSVRLYGSSGNLDTNSRMYIYGRG